MRLSPRKTQYPEVDLRVSRHPAQSASVYEIRVVMELHDKWSTICNVPFTYRRMRFRALKCSTRGACMCMQTCWTAYVMSGLVKVRYISSNTITHYCHSHYHYHYPYYHLSQKTTVNYHLKHAKSYIDTHNRTNYMCECYVSLCNNVFIYNYLTY